MYLVSDLLVAEPTTPARAGWIPGPESPTPALREARSLGMRSKTSKEGLSLPGHNMPYLATYGNITKALEAIQRASTPERFTQDFLAAKLGLTGGSARPVVPFLKKTGFLSSEGAPTGLYKQFRNPAQRGAAAAAALRTGYAPLFEVDEQIHTRKDADLKGVIVQVTGLDHDSPAIKQLIGSFKALRTFADFGASSTVEDEIEGERADGERTDGEAERTEAPVKIADFRLGYTINLNLPATSDIAVFNAIFRSLREHILE